MAKFVASVRCYQVKAYDGTVLTKEDTVAWLSVEEGYYQLTEAKSRAKVFSNKEEITRSAHRWDGMPWYYRMKPDTLTIHDVTGDVNYMSRSELIKLVQKET